MDTVESLERQNSVDIANTVKCLTLLLETYPLAQAYPHNSDFQKRYINAQHCYRKSYGKLIDFQRGLKTAEMDDDSRKEKLLAALSEMRVKNEAGIVELKRTESSALGADGLYVDLLAQYRAELIKMVILLLGTIIMGTRLYERN